MIDLHCCECARESCRFQCLTAFLRKTWILVTRLSNAQHAPQQLLVVTWLIYIVVSAQVGELSISASHHGVMHFLTENLDTCKKRLFEERLALNPIVGSQNLTWAAKLKTWTTCEKCVATLKKYLLEESDVWHTLSRTQRHRCQSCWSDENLGTFAKPHGYADQPIDLIEFAHSSWRKLSIWFFGFLADVALANKIRKVRYNANRLQAIIFFHSSSADDVLARGRRRFSPSLWIVFSALPKRN